MSYFAATLQNLLDERQMSQLQLYHLSGVSQSQISQYILDGSRPGRTALHRLCAAFAHDAPRLLISWFRDEVPPELQDAIQFTHLAPEGEPPNPISAAYERLPKDVRAILDTIAAEAEQNPALVRMLESAIELFRRSKAPPA